MIVFGKGLVGILLILFMVEVANSQDYPYDIEPYPFVDCNKNTFSVFDIAAYARLFDKFTQIGLQGQGKVSIVHIGDSHLQADYWSGQFRRKLQTFFLGSMGGRGFIFPYKVAKTNNPLNYRVQSTGEWISCRNVERDKFCNLGLSGISITTYQNNSSVTVTIDDPKLQGYDFDELMVFHDFGEDSFIPVIDHPNIEFKESYPDKGYTLFHFNANISTVKLILKQENPQQNKFVLHGLNFDSNDSGIIYHTVGVNGAMYESYVRCPQFGNHLSALNPDWVILSLGTNDLYTAQVDTIAFKANVDRLIAVIYQAAPNAAVLITAPADHRIRKGGINNQVAVGTMILAKIAQNKHCSFWNFYEIMGGYGSVNNWYKAGMVQPDYLHFSEKGYEYQAQLFFNAFLKSYDGYVVHQLGR